MVTNRKKKCTKLRGSRYCTFGPNKHRGAGQRGGRGNSGSGKKCDSKKTKIWGTKSQIGKKGFISRNNDVVINTINLRDVQDKLDHWLSVGLVSKEGEFFVVDLSKLGYTKLLSAGKVVSKMKVTVPVCSSKVEEKLKAAGSELVK